MKLHNNIRVDSLNIEQANNGFIVNYWSGSITYRELCADWKTVIKFIQDIEID